MNILESSEDKFEAFSRILDSWEKNGKFPQSEIVRLRERLNLLIDEKSS